MDIVTFEHLTAAQRADCARILREAFVHIPAYQEDGEAEAEIETFLTVPERFALAALDGQTVVGLIGGIDTYSHAAELHPLASIRVITAKESARRSPRRWRPAWRPWAS